MNQEFGLLATPAIARRLVLLAAICQIEISEPIRALAREQTVPETLFDPLFPCSEDRRYGTQFIIDCGFRCVVVRQFCWAMDMSSVLNATRHAPEKGVLLFTASRLQWKPIVKQLRMTDRVSYINQPACLLEEVTSLRDRILIVDVNTHSVNMGYQIAAVLRLFPMSLIYVRIADIGLPLDHPSWARYWTPWADLLFPQMPSLSNNPSAVQAALFHNVLPPKLLP